MGGLEKITEHIIENAKAEADVIIKNAEAQTDEIKRNASVERAKRKALFEEKINAECEKYLQMSSGQDKQEQRQILLSSRSQAIESIISEAKQRIKNAGKEEYISMFKKLLKNAVTEKSGEILFSKHDKEMIDAETIGEIDTISKGLLKISHELAEADCGFILRYGKIEINCSVDSIFEDRYNELTDLVNSCIITG